MSSPVLLTRTGARHEDPNETAVLDEDGEDDQTRAGECDQAEKVAGEHVRDQDPDDGDDEDTVDQNVGRRLPESPRDEVSRGREKIEVGQRTPNRTQPRRDHLGPHERCTRSVCSRHLSNCRVRIRRPAS
jgi:hypothetical protein